MGRAKNSKRVYAVASQHAPAQRPVLQSMVVAVAVISVLLSSVTVGIVAAFSHAANRTPTVATVPPSQAAARAHYGTLPLSYEANEGQAPTSAKFVARGPGFTALLEPSGVVIAPLTGGAPVTMRLANSTPHPELISGAKLHGVANYLIGRNPAQWHVNVPTYAGAMYYDVYPGVDMMWEGTQNAPEYAFSVAPWADPSAIRMSFEGARSISVDRATGDLLVTTPDGTLRQRAPQAFVKGHGGSIPASASFHVNADGTVGFSVGARDASRPLVIDPTLAYSTYLGGSLDEEALGIAVDTAGSAYVTGSTCSANFPTKNAIQTTYTGPCENTPFSNGPIDMDGAAFVSKLSPDGTALVYSTYIGGSRFTNANAIAVDSSGDAFIAGGTVSSDFPTTAGAYQTVCATVGQVVPFAAELTPAGTALAYSTCLGGRAFPDVAGAIAVHGGRMYIAGYTGSSDFPVTAGAFQTSRPGGEDAYVSVIAPAGGGSSDLAYSTYLGGSGLEAGINGAGIGVAVDAAGVVYVVGATSSHDFPVTAGAFQMSLALDPSNNGQDPDAFISKINPAGGGRADLLYSTYLGGFPSTNPADGNAFGADGATSVAVGPPEPGSSMPTIYVAGATASPDFPTTSGAVQTYPFVCSDVGCMGFVSKLNPAGGGSSDLDYSTYLGGTGAPNHITGIAVDPLNGDAVVSGDTLGTAYPTKNATQSTCGCFAGPGNDAVVSEIRPDPSGTRADNLIFSTFLGGTGLEFGFGVAVDSLGSIYVTGATDGTDVTGNRKFPAVPFPTTPGAFQTTFGGGTIGSATSGIPPYDAFVTKIAFADLSVSMTASPSPGLVKQPLTYTITATDAGPSPITAIATDPLPKGAAFVSASPGCTVSGTKARVVTCAVGVISAGGSASVTITVKPGSPGTLTNTASVDGDAVDLTPSDNTVTTATTITR